MLPKREWLEESSAYYEAIDMSQLNGRHKWTNRAVVSKPDELSRRFHMCSQRKSTDHEELQHQNKKYLTCHQVSILSNGQKGMTAIKTPYRSLWENGPIASVNNVLILMILLIYCIMFSIRYRIEVNRRFTLQWAGLMRKK